MGSDFFTLYIFKAQHAKNFVLRIKLRDLILVRLSLDGIDEDFDANHERFILLLIVCNSLNLLTDAIKDFKRMLRVNVRLAIEPVHEIVLLISS